MQNFDPIMEPTIQKDTLSRSQNPENYALFNCTSSYRKMYEYLHRQPNPRENFCICSTVSVACLPCSVSLSIHLHPLFNHNFGTESAILYFSNNLRKQSKWKRKDKNLLSLSRGGKGVHGLCEDYWGSRCFGKITSLYLSILCMKFRKFY